VAQGQAESHGIQLVFVEGPCKIQNNLIEAAGINLFFGDNFDIPNPAQDVEIRGNHLRKPLHWKEPICSGPNAGLRWKVKNLFELKAAKRLLVEGNIFENNWPSAQNGVAIVITPRGGDVSDITFRKNVLRNPYSGFNINPANPNRHIDRILIEDNLVCDVERRVFLMGLGEGETGTHITIRHNTVASTLPMYSLFFIDGGRTINFDQFLMQDNLFTNGNYGIGGTGLAAKDAFAKWFTNYTLRNDAFIGGGAHPYPDPPFEGYYYPADNAAVQFEDLMLTEVEDFKLKPTSAYKSKATDGKDLGADIVALLAAIQGVASGDYTPPPRTPPNTSGPGDSSWLSGVNVLHSKSNTPIDFRFRLDSPTLVTIEIYSRTGASVKNLFNGECLAGESRIMWDGRNNVGESVASGIYIAKIKAGDRELKRTLVVIR